MVFSYGLLWFSNIASLAGQQQQQPQQQRGGSAFGSSLNNKSGNRFGALSTSGAFGQQQQSTPGAFGSNRRQTHTQTKGAFGNQQKAAPFGTVGNQSNQAAGYVPGGLAVPLSNMLLCLIGPS
eukprot:718913-Prorocentrum_minimum.AAC.3